MRLTELASAMRLHLGFLICLLLMPGISTPVQNTQQVVPVPELDPGTLGQPGFRFADGVSEVVDLIPHGDGARNGHLWIGNSGQSIRIVGEVDGNGPNWSKDEASILQGNHIEVWLAGPEEIVLPKTGWADESDYNLLDSADDCNDKRNREGDDVSQACKKWFNVQQKYRPVFKRLFIRQWLLSENLSVESYASNAYKLASRAYAGDALAILKPHGQVSLRSVPRPGKSGYMFEVDIPFSSFPPLNTKELSELRLMVDVYNAAPRGKKEGAFSTTSIIRSYGNPETFNVLRFEKPILFEVTPCHSSLEGSDSYIRYSYSPRNKYPAWFIPVGDSETEFSPVAFTVANGSTMDSLEGAGKSISPTIFPMNFFWRTLGSTEWVCGPNLTYRNGNTIRPYPMFVPEGELDARKGPDGLVMIKVGPSVSTPGSNAQCGACPRMNLFMFTLDHDLNLQDALSIEDRMGGGDEPHSGDITVSPDWSRIVEYLQSDQNKTWSSVTYCLEKAVYKECDRKNGVSPPNPPVLRQLIDAN